MADSRFVQLTSYCMVEYVFRESTDYTHIIEDDITVVRNENTSQNQSYMPNTDNLTFKNVQDVSVIYIGDNKYVLNDSEVVPNYSDYADGIISSNVSSRNVPYDIVRFHFVAGFTFSEFPALILALSHTQNDLVQNYFFEILANEYTIDFLSVFNSKPMFITDALYDRYIEVKIPSIQWINEQYYTLPPSGRYDSLAADLTPKTGGGYVGFLKDAPIRISIHECAQGNDLINEDDGNVKYEVWTSQNYKEASIPQISRFDKLGSVIKEAEDGNYIQYYATEDGAFIEDFIGILESENPNDDWVIIHQLAVFEQVGTTFINTYNLMSIQEKNFDAPNNFRPVLQYADRAVSFSVDYLYRLTNRRNGEQIIRRGSYSSMDVRKYGKSPIMIELDGPPKSHKIYNKIINNVNSVSRLFIEPTIEDSFVSSTSTGESTVVEKNVYIPVFFDYNRITIANKTYNVLSNGGNQNLIYRQGDLRIVITPLDNYFKFKIYEVVNGVPSPLNMDIAATYLMRFYTVGSDSIAVEYDPNPTMSKLSSGEVSFKLSKSDALEVMRINNRTWYITSVSDSGVESLIYSGFWNTSSEMDQVKAAEQNAINTAVTIDATQLSAKTQAPSTNVLNIPGAIPPKQSNASAETSIVFNVNPSSSSGQ